MATRVNRKTAASVPKEVVSTEKTAGKNEPTESPPKSSGTAKPIGKRIAKKPTKKIVKKSLGVKLKAKVQKLKLNPLAKAVLQNPNKKKLLKNGVKEVKPRKKKVQIKNEPESEDSPPVLEPIFPLEENLLSKKQPRKRVAKNTKIEIPELIDATKIKQEVDEDLSSDVTDTSFTDIPSLSKQVKKTRPLKKPKIENESLEDVMNDLSFLIKAEDIKKESDTLSESGKSDTTTKSKKLTKKQKIELLKKKMIKKENLENTLSKLDSADEKIIDMLDLNVNVLKKKTAIKRRHSIEKCPIGPTETTTDTVNVFSPLPRSLSPRAKRKPKQERRSSPYSTRSDSPARILRNGKQRKLKDLGLLEGLDLEIKKRRRICSDSGSKLSGYESDSSYSDLASLHGTESNEATIKDEDKPTASNGPIDTLGLIDTNSNIYTNTEDSLPEKNILLDIMKQTFNNEVDVKKTGKFKVGTVAASRFYGRRNTTTSQDKPETIKDEIKEKIADEAPVMEDETELNLSSAVQEVLESENTEEFSENTQNLTDNSQILTENLETLIDDSQISTDQPQTFTDILIEAASIPEETPPQLEEAIPTAEKEYIPEDTNCDKPADTLPEEEQQTENESNEPPEDIPNTEEPNAIQTETLELENSSTEPVPEETVNEAECTEIEEEQILEPALTENGNAVIENTEEDVNLTPEETAEKAAEKESILKALGLQRAKLAEEARQKTKDKPSGSTGDGYTGTLKTVIKINRDKKKGNRSSAKISMQKSKMRSNASTEDEQLGEEVKDKGNKEKEPSPSWKHGTHSSDTAGAHRKSHYSNRSNMDGSSEHTSDGEAAPQDGTIKALVIPEKASSFSIHPGRLCKDECSYCFGKFGLFDTPCHIAQMKSVDRQNKILATEKHLTRDSCLCDACYRHVDRKSNTPSYMNKSLKRNSMVAPGPRQNHCHVLGCSKESTNILRRKWIIKMRKSICQVINLDLDNPGLHSIPICDEHYSALEHLMICAMCRRRLARNHIHYLGPETNDLNDALKINGIPLMLNDKPVVCKLCKCFASIILKDPAERPETSNNFFVEYKKRLLHFNDIVPMDESAAEEPIAVPSKADRIDILKKKKKLLKIDNTEDEQEKMEERVPLNDINSQPQSRSESPIDDYNGVDYNTLIPAIAMDVGSDTESRNDNNTPGIIKKLTEMQREGVEIVKVSKIGKTKPDAAFKKFGYGSAVSVRQLFPGEEDLSFSGTIEFNNVKEKTPEGWERCSTTIQYDEETKRLWQELQKPYGNQSSFLRHLILLEKYFRNGDLVLSPHASHHSINYSESVHNRLRAYDNIPSSAGNIQPLSMLPFNKMNNKFATGSNIPAATDLIPNTSSLSLSAITTNGKPIGSTAISVTSIPKSTPLTISQLNSPPLIPATSTAAALQPARPKMVGQPPGLISLHPGTTRPVAPLVKVPQPQKIKFPITKNWRPNLIPIDPTKKQERKTGLVQVISGGKPYHITLEDYKKMCAIKRSFELKQKRLQEAQAPKSILVTHNSVLKSIIPRKGLVISKTATIAPKPEPLDGVSEGENILEKLDKQVEKLEAKLNEKPAMSLPRIPKSLTVIPQTVTKKPDRPSSPVLLITKNTKS